MTDVFIEITDINKAKSIWAHLAKVSVFPTQLSITARPSSQNITIEYACCFKFLLIDWTNIELFDNHLHLIPLPRRGAVSVWTPSSINRIDPEAHYNIRILGRILDHIFEIPLAVHPLAPPPRTHIVQMSTSTQGRAHVTAQHVNIPDAGATTTPIDLFVEATSSTGTRPKVKPRKAQVTTDIEMEEI